MPSKKKKKVSKLLLQKILFQNCHFKKYLFYSLKKGNFKFIVSINTLLKLLSKNCSLKIHSQNCCLIKFFFKKYIFKTTLSKSFLFKKSTFPKLLCQKKHFQISKNINLIALIYSSSYSSNSSEEEKITQIIMNICNYFFLNIFTLLKRLVDNSVHACESRIQANYC